MKAEITGSDVFTTIFVGSICCFGSFLLGWDIGPDVSNEPKGDPVERCAPYQAIHYFHDRGHRLVVCRIPTGLVVRDLEVE